MLHRHPCWIVLFIALIGGWSVLSANENSGEDKITGATLDESTVTLVYHVDGAKGDDGNTGLSITEAFATIRKGLTAARASVVNGIPTKLLIHTGVYREDVSDIGFEEGQGIDTLLVIEGETQGAVIMDGSDVFPAKKWTKEAEGVYSHPWPYTFGNYFHAYSVKKGNLLAHRSEMVFVNSKPLRQVILENYDYRKKKFQKELVYTYTKFRNPRKVLKPGSFGVTERPEHGNKIYVALAPGVTPDNVRVEVSVRRSLLKLLKNNLVVRNIVFRRTANSLQTHSLNLSHPNPEPLLLDDFQNGAKAWISPKDWSVVEDQHLNQPPQPGGKSRVTTTKKVYRRTGTEGSSMARCGKKTWRDYRVIVKVRPEGQQGLCGLAFRLQDNGDGYALLLSGENPSHAGLYALQEKKCIILDEAEFLQEPGEYVRLKVEVTGSGITAYANGKKLFTYNDLKYKSGGLGLFCVDTLAKFASLMVYPHQPSRGNVLLDGCDFVWNNSVGLCLWNLRDVTLRNCRMNYNGYSGLLTGGGVDNLLMEDCQTNFNNWRGFWGGWRGWFIAGAKFHMTNHQRMDRHVSFGNLAPGIWYDIHCHHIDIRDLVAVSSLNPLLLELSAGPFHISRSLLVHTGPAGWGGGLQASIVGQVEVRDTILYDFGGATRPPLAYSWHVRRDTHWTYEPFTPASFRLIDSVIAGPKSKVLVSVQSKIPQGDYRYTPLQTAYRGGSGNIYFGPDPQHAFVWMGQKMNLQDWSRQVNETDSRWKNPRFTNPTRLDFTLQPGSPLQKRAESLQVIRIPRQLIREANAFYQWAGYVRYNLADVEKEPPEK